MKHTYKLLLVLVAITFVAACKKSSSSPANPIVGKWTVVSDTIRLYQGGTLSDVSAADSLTAADFFQFNSNGTGSESDFGFSSTFKWSVSGSTLTVNADARTDDGIQIPASTSTAVIKILDAHTLYLYISETASIDNDVFPETEAIHLTK